MLDVILTNFKINITNFLTTTNNIKIILLIMSFYTVILPEII